MTVHFENVGRFKQSWSVNVKSLSYKVMIDSIRKQRALASNSVEFVFNDEGTGGLVIVGGCRPVGSFRVEGGAELEITI